MRRILSSIFSLSIILLMPLNASMDSILSISLRTFQNPIAEKSLTSIALILNLIEEIHLEEEDSSSNKPSSKKPGPLNPFEEVEETEHHFSQFIVKSLPLVSVRLSTFQPHFWHYHNAFFSIDFKDIPLEPPEYQV